MDRPCASRSPRRALSGAPSSATAPAGACAKLRTVLAARPDATSGLDLVLTVRKAAIDAPAALVRGAVERQLGAVFE